MIKRNNMKITAMSLVVGMSLLTGCSKQGATIQTQIINNNQISSTSNASGRFSNEGYSKISAKWS